MASETDTLIAPCGINCSLCMAFMRKRNPCPGCRVEDKHKPITRTKCGIKTCKGLARNNYQFCFSCAGFPCNLIRRMDTRYRKRYGFSTILNLESIKEKGIGVFLEEEKIKWTCSNCGTLLCIHKTECENCKQLRQFIIK